MRASCEVDVTEDDPFGLDERFGFDDEFDFIDYIIQDVLEDDVNEDLLATEDSEEGDLSEEEDKQAQIVPMIAEAPTVLESCLRIEKVPGVCQVKTNNVGITLTKQFVGVSYALIEAMYLFTISIRLPSSIV